MKTPETLRILEKYVAKKLHGAIKKIEKDAYGYEVELNSQWLFERNNTGFFSSTIKELKEDLKKVEKYEEKEYSAIMEALGNVEQANEVLLDIDEFEEDEDEEEVGIIIEIEEDEETEEEEEAEEVERTYLKDIVGQFHFNPQELNENWIKGTQGWYTKRQEEANWIRRIINAYEILDELNEFVDPSISSYDELIAFADRVQEERMVKFELELRTLRAVYFDHEFYDLQFDTSLGDINLRVKAIDHPEAETNADYFEDEKLIFRLVRDATLEDIGY